MAINIELEPVIINKQSSFIEDAISTASMKDEKKITLKTAKLAKIDEIKIILEAIQGDAKE